MAEEIKTPTGLKARSRRLWKTVTTDYELRADELDLLEDACREMDLFDALERELKGAAYLVKGSQGQDVINPLVAEIRQHRATKKSLWGALKLPDDEQTSTAVNAQRKGGLSRWSTHYGNAS